MNSETNAILGVVIGIIVEVKVWCGKADFSVNDMDDYPFVSCMEFLG